MKHHSRSLAFLVGVGVTMTACSKDDIPGAKVVEFASSASKGEATWQLGAQAALDGTFVALFVVPGIGEAIGTVRAVQPWLGGIRGFAARQLLKLEPVRTWVIAEAGEWVLIKIGTLEIQKNARLTGYWIVDHAEDVGGAVSDAAGTVGTSAVHAGGWVKRSVSSAASSVGGWFGDRWAALDL